jgi:hypothetical protein
MRTIERLMVRMAHPTAQPAIADLSGLINGSLYQSNLPNL